jgi:HK97 family phage major capsid protein
MHSEIRTKVKRNAEDIHLRAVREGRALTAAESTEFDELIARVAELDEQELRSDAAAKHRVEIGGGSGRARFTTSGPEVYNDPREAGLDQPSFFKDLRNSKLGDWAAAERLNRNEQARGMESRAGDLTSTGATSGGSFAPPDWILSEWIGLARAGRITADQLNKQVLPSGVSSVNLPKISGGSSVAVQATQNSSVSDTAVQTTSVSAGITTIAGKQIVALQLLNQSVDFDHVILGDLAADYARQLCTQVISGSGSSGQLRGLLNGASVGATTYTTATPKVIDGTTAANSFYNKVVSAVNTVATTRYMPGYGDHHAQQPVELVS